MEKFQPARYVEIHTKRFVRTFANHPMREVAKIVRDAAIAGAAITTLLGAYDIVSHANGGDGLTQGYNWVAVEHGNCISVGVVASHSVAPNEEVSLRIRPFTGSPDEHSDATIDIDLSGQAIATSVQEFCGQSGIVFVAKNGELFGSEQVYIPTSP